MKMSPEKMRPMTQKERDNPFEKAGYEGEAIVYRLLEQLEIESNALAIHNAFTKHHPNHPLGEVDFVLVTPRGVFVIEVKNWSRFRATESGFFDGERPIKEKKLPWNQASLNAVAIHNALKSGSDSIWSEVGSGVVFVGLPKVGPMPPEAGPIMWGDAVESGVDGMRTFIDRMIQDTRNLECRKGRSSPSLRPEQVESVCRKLRPIFETKVPLIHQFKHAEDRRIQLTAEQFSILRGMHGWERVIIDGGAGTGKTQLAKDFALLKASKDESVAIVVRSPFLARRLNACIIAGRESGHEHVDVLSAADIDDRQRRGESRKYDWVIVDEGQDLLNGDHYDRIESLLEGGMEHGHWCWFMDSQFQSGLYEPIDQDYKNTLESCADGKPYQLTKNCRNTSQVIDFIRNSICADIGLPAQHFEGPEPRVVRLATGNKVEVLEELEAIVNDFLEQAPSDVGCMTIVAIGDVDWIYERANDFIGDLKGKVRRINATDLDNWPPRDKVLLATPDEIKGLENDHIVVVTHRDVDPACDRGLSEHYVALTRAMSQLTWVCPQAILDGYRERFESTSAT